MTQDEARAFAFALNTIAPYVPPMLFGQVIGSPVSQIIQDVANGHATVEVRRVNGRGGETEHSQALRENT